MLAKIEALSTMTHVTVPGEDPEQVRLLSENQLLRRELALHADFVTQFQRLMGEEASAEAQTRQEIYTQGADSAHTFLMGLLSESRAWTRAALPPGVDIPLPSLEFRFAFRSALFNQPEDGGRTRLHLRLDAVVPGCTAKSVQDLFFRALCCAADMRKMYGASKEVQMFKMDSPDEDTELLYFRRIRRPVEADQHSVFICNKRTHAMTKSSLAPCDDSLEFGTVAAHIVAMTTTSVLPKDDPILVRMGDAVGNAADSVPVSGTVVKGVFVWDDPDSGGVRFVVLYSVPEDCQVRDLLSFEDIVVAGKPSSSSGASSSSSSSSRGDAEQAAPPVPKQRAARRAASSASMTSADSHSSASTSSRLGSSAGASAGASTGAAPVPKMTLKFAQVLQRVVNEFKMMVAEGLEAQWYPLV